MSTDTIEEHFLSGAEFRRSIRSDASDESILQLLQTKKIDEDSNQIQGIISFYLGFYRPSFFVMEKLIEQGADINYQDGTGWTTLHHAIKNQNLESVCMLLYYNVDVSINCGNTSTLLKAIYAKNLDIVEVLLDHHFDNPACSQAVMFMAKLWKSSEITQDSELCIKQPDFYKWGDISRTLNKWPNTVDIYKALCPLFDSSNCTNLYTFLEDYTQLCVYPPHQFIDCFFAILESPVISDLVHTYNVNSFNSPACLCFISNLLEYFVKHNIAKDTRLNILYTCLSLGFEIHSTDFIQIYNYFGYSEELESVMYAGKLRWTNCECIPSYPIPAYIAFFERIATLTCMYQYLLYVADVEEILVSLQFFSVPDPIKQHLMETDIVRCNKQILKKLKEVPTFPKLTQLCRDQVRKTFINTRRYKIVYQYLEAVRKLHVPELVQDVILFKKGLY